MKIIWNFGFAINEKLFLSVICGIQMRLLSLCS